MRLRKVKSPLSRSQDSKSLSNRPNEGIREVSSASEMCASHSPGNRGKVNLHTGCYEIPMQVKLTKYFWFFQRRKNPFFLKKEAKTSIQFLPTRAARFTEPLY